MDIFLTSGTDNIVKPSDLRLLAFHWDDIMAADLLLVDFRLVAADPFTSEQIGSQMMVSSRAQASLLDRGGSA